MAAVYQLKIKYDHDKWGAIFLDSFDTMNFSRQKLVDKLCKATSRFNHIDDQDLRIRYLDDEKTFVDLSDQNSVQEMFRCGVPVENAEFKRITVMVEQSNSPAPILRYQTIIRSQDTAFRQIQNVSLKNYLRKLLSYKVQLRRVSLGFHVIFVAVPSVSYQEKPFRVMPRKRNAFSRDAFLCGAFWRDVFFSDLFKRDTFLSYAF